MEVGGRTIERYLYADSASEDVHGAGVPIVVDVGQRLQIDVRNSTDTATNIHWHGMSVPNDQDGPGILIEPGQEHRYEFTAARAGTYWYHSHERPPVRDQVDRGMYAPFIVREPADARYDLDQVLVLDDWVVDRTTGHMEVVGDVDTVNGRTGDDIEPISITAGQIAKLRLVNASTAKTQNLTFPLDVRVTHTDGAPPLVEPYSTRRLSIAPPGERYDVELAPVGDLSSGLSITNERDNGMTIPRPLHRLGCPPRGCLALHPSRTQRPRPPRPGEPRTGHRDGARRRDGDVRRHGNGLDHQRRRLPRCRDVRRAGRSHLRRPLPQRRAAPDGPPDARARCALPGAVHRWTAPSSGKCGRTP